MTEDDDPLVLSRSGGQNRAGVSMTIQRRELYRSTNGDRWYLVREAERVFVRHEPNVSSGGRPTDIDVGRFLVHDTHGPEHRELLRLIGTLAQVGPE